MSDTPRTDALIDGCDDRITAEALLHIITQHACQLERELAAARRETAEKVREACKEAAHDHECHTWAECCDCRGKIEDAIDALDLSPFIEREVK